MSAVKKAVKKVGKWVKKNFKYIVIAAALVFTAGLATVGTAGFASASAAAGGGFAGALSAAGSTMVAGVASIGGTLGIGQGANLAAFGGSGYATLGTGAAAQGLGLAGAQGTMTAARTAQMAAAAPSAALGGGPPAALAGAGAAPSAAPSAMAGTSALSGAPAAAPAAGGFLSKPATGMLLQAGMGLIGNYMQARQQEEEWDRIKPKGYFGVGLNGTPDAQGPLPGAPRDAQGNIQPMWSTASFNPPPPQVPNSPNYSGNAALDGGYQQDPVNNALNPDFDPTAQHIGPRRG